MKHEILKAILDVGQHPTILSIDGPAGSGKTTLADELKFELENLSKTTHIVHMDDLYNGWDDALTSTLSERLLEIIKQSQTSFITYPVFDWVANAQGESRTIKTPEILILEGVGSGQAAIRSKVSLAIWIEVEPSLGLKRVLKRDGEGLLGFMTLWQEQQSAHFRTEGTMGAADYCLDGAPST